MFYFPTLLYIVVIRKNCLGPVTSVLGPVIFYNFFSLRNFPRASYHLPGERDLFAGKPYSSPGAILRRLKRAPKHICKKCYDSLPMLVNTLCPGVAVPELQESDKYQAVSRFRALDDAYNQGEPFVSYLFALEYILELIQRSDMLPFINKIQCRKRRAAYRWCLDKIFKHKTRS